MKLVVPDNFIEFGKKVNEHIKLIKKEEKDFIVRPNLIRFNNGEGKCTLEDSIRGKDTYLLSDVTNYSITYECQTGIHNMMPDEHFQDIKRIINATCEHSKKMTVVLPYLYQSRQEKRNGRESLDLAMALGELKHYGVHELVTADVHNKSACDNASPKIPIDNFYCSDDIILNLLRNEDINMKNIMVVSPDFGAMARANFYASLLGNVPLGVFYKQRDYSVVSDGKNPIMKHKFLYEGSIKNKQVIIVDDMIASGGSILDTATQLRKKGADKIYLLSTFGLFTAGSKKFDEAYENKIFDRVYVTNLNYVPEEIKNKEWFQSVDCSYKLANLISELNYGHSIGEIINCKTDTAVKIKRLRRGYEKNK